MAEPVTLAMQGVSKRFRRGQLHDSLRDFLPALVGRLWSRPARAGKQEFWALRDVSFEVTRGEAFGIIGRNGAGKSTILKILSGIMQPTQGTMQVRGRLAALIEVGAGFHPDLTGRENVFLSGAILGMTRAEIRRKFDEIVAFSELADFMDTPVKRYSSGMFARLGFAVAAHVNPDVLIVDEVLSVGDYVFQLKCQRRMEEILAAGATIIYVSHNLRSVVELCDRVLLLDHGQVQTCGPAEAVVQRYLAQAPDPNRGAEGREASLSRVTVRGMAGEQLAFTAGDRAWVDIEITAHQDLERLAVVLFLDDATDHEIFSTSTQRLGSETISLRKGQSFRCTFQIDLHLARGTFRLGTSIYRYDIQREYDCWRPAASLFITSERDVRGAANLYPEVTRFGRATESGAEALATPSRIP